jgi:uncharacterized ferritin-like protein (DUF455 family)
METEAFLADMDRLVGEALAHVRKTPEGPASAPPIPVLLQIALRNELEASEEAALWMTTEQDLEVKLALARQCGDEAKHYRLIEQRLSALGVRPPSGPVHAFGPMFRHLASLQTTVERIAAGPFAREALAQARNQAFIEYCEAMGDAETAKLYREVIQPDESFHHQLGRNLLRSFARSSEAQSLARQAALGTLALAEELQETVRLERGLVKVPGC